MDFEVIVVGAGIGGLVTASLLAARGVRVGLFERQSRIGGCVADFEHSGFRFEPTYGLCRGWEQDGVFASIFSELRVTPPQAEPLATPYVVRLPDGIDVPVSSDQVEFENCLRDAFPECASDAITFYRSLPSLKKAEANPNPVSTNLSGLLQRCSLRFRRFIDIQLQTLTHCSSADSGFDRAVVALNPCVGFWTIKGGAQALADSLAASFKESGGTLRLNAPVLRLAYASEGTPVGLDLLGGERVTARRAIVSNLTVWDTYGKLIGINLTPREISAKLKKLHGWGFYLLFASLDESRVSRLPSHRILALTDWQDNQGYDPEQPFVFSAVPATEARAPDGKLAVTISSFTRGEDWFSFHEDHQAHETQDQSMLESLWARVHKALPELGDGIEIIDSATPQTFYATTRRKFGMVGGVCSSPVDATPAFTRPFANVFLVGDTVANGAGIDALAAASHQVANQILTTNPEQN